MKSRSTLAAAASPPSLRPARVRGMLIGELMEVTAQGALVHFRFRRRARKCAALSTIALKPSDVGARVALAFEQGKPARAIIIGLLQKPVLEAAVDGHRLELSAEQEVVLRCGKSSITLTRAGKVIIRGAYLLSRSSGVNRIKGGSVQIN